MKKAAFFIISLIVGFLLLFFAIYQAGISEILSAVSAFPYQIILVIFLINVASICVIGSIRWKIIIEAQNSCKVSFLKILKAKTVGFAVSYVTPSVLIGGEPIRAYMIKQESDCSFEKSFASVVIDQTIYFFVLFLFSIAGFLFLIEHFSMPRSIFYSFVAVFILSTAIFYFFYSKLINKKKNEKGFFMFIIKSLKLDKVKFVKNRQESIERTEAIISEFFRNKKSAFFKTLSLTFLEVSTYIVVIAIFILQVNHKFDFMQSISVFSFLALANFVPIPASVGSSEAILTFAFSALGLGKSNGFMLVIIMRLVNILIVLAGAVIMMHFEAKKAFKSFGVNSLKISLVKIYKTIMKQTCKNKQIK